jgi:hypothetical protein
MSTSQLSCPGDERLNQLRALADPAHNGIDYLEVLPSKRALVVHCVADIDPLAADNVLITGGVRVLGITVLSASRGDLVPAGLLTSADAAALAQLSDLQSVLVVRTSSSGDYSTYTLTLVDSASDPALAPPARFDAQLAAIGFSFKVDCPSDFDCAPVDNCPPQTWPAVEIDYLAKDYASFRRLLLDRLSHTLQAWQETHLPDLGITLVELFAYIGDRLSQFQDAVTTEAYLGTARRRTSVRRHALLLDYAMHDGANARTLVCFEAAAGSEGTVVPAGTPIVTSGAQLGSGDHPLEQAISMGATVFETMHALTLHEHQNAIEFYTWGDPQCCLPAGATRATLRGTSADLALQAGDLLVFVERLGPVTGRPEDARLSQRHAVRLTADPADASDFLAGPTSVVEIEWHPDDALPFPLCLHEFGGQLSSVALGNAALADHGLTVTGESFAVPEDGTFSPTLARPAVSQQVPYDDAVARGTKTGPDGLRQRRAAGDALAVDPTQAVPHVALQGEGETWEPVRTLLESDAFAPEFVAETEDSGLMTLRFGDGVLGRKPRGGETYTASYRIGNGTPGNVGADALSDVVAAIPRVTHARNPLPATGGTDPEDVELVRQYAPAAFRVQERAVTEVDYAEVCERHPEVMRAAATRRYTGSWYTMFVTVDRAGGTPVDAAFRQELEAFFDRYRLAGGDVEIDGPSFVALDIELHVCVTPGYIAVDVERHLYDVFSSGITSSGALGYFAPDNWTFGQTVYLSPIVAAAMAVPGVDRVTPTVFQRYRELAAGELAGGRLAIGRLEIAQLDNDPSRPENGRLLLDMDGGS